MKILTLLGVASLLANAALLAVVGYGVLASKPPQPGPVATPSPADTTPGVAAEPKDIWTSLNSDSLATKRDVLQAEGFPPGAIRAILAAQIREQFAARRKSLEAASQDQPYWKNPIPNREVQAQLRALFNEEQKILRELLGPDPINSHAARLRREFPHLTPEKTDQVAAIRERYDEMRQEVYGTSRGSITPSEREKINSFEKAMHQEIASVLSREELENYDLRTSNTANQLRHSLADFNATEAEFRALFRLQSEFDQQHRFVGGGQTQEQQKTRNDAYKMLNDDIAATLGPARFAEYQRSSDYNFRQTNLLVSRLNLPPDTATKLYAVQKEVEERRTAFYRDMAGRPPATSEQLTTLANDATARITTIFGGNKTATEFYKQYGGSWLTNLTPRPAPAPSAKK
jgi:hypothetical protein